MILGRTVTIVDPLARANLVEALTGAGAPSGITSCTLSDATVAVSFDDERTAPELIDDLIWVETTFVPARAAAIADLARATTIAAQGLVEPALDTERIIETYLW